MYRITLGDGTVLDNLSVNGNMLVSADETLSASRFEDNLHNVKIEHSGENDDLILATGTHEHMKLITCQKYPRMSGVYFVLEDYTAEEIKELRTEARLDYLEMMSE